MKTHPELQAVPQVVLTDPVPVRVQVRGSSERGVDQFEFGSTTIRAGGGPVRVRVRIGD